MGPDQLFVFAVDLADVIVMRLLTDIDRRYLALDHIEEAGGDVPALAFGLEDHAAAMGRAGVGTEHAEEVRKIRHRQAEIGGWIVVRPCIGKLLAVGSRDIETRRHFRDLEPGRDHDHLRAPQFLVGRHDAIAREVIDRVRNQLHIRFGQRPEPAIVEQDAFAIGRISRHAFLDQIGAILQLG